MTISLDKPFIRLPRLETALQTLTVLREKLMGGVVSVVGSMFDQITAGLHLEPLVKATVLFLQGQLFQLEAVRSADQQILVNRGV